MARRRPRAHRASRIDRRTGVLAVLCIAVVALYATLVPIQAALYGTPLALAFIAVAALCGSPLLAVSHPRWAIALLCAAALVLALVVDPGLATESPWPWSVPALLSFLLFIAVVAFVHGARIGAFPLVLGNIAALSAPILRGDIAGAPGAAAPVTANLIVAGSLSLAAYLIAALLAGRQRVAAELTREREHSALEEARRALVEERTRIARELHDVIAHSMSVIQVQASTARYRLPEIDETASAEFDSIAATARGSLVEMRRMLGVLRTEDHGIEFAPQQGIDDIPALVDTIRRAGVTVGLEITGPVSDASTACQIGAFRITQEALSNAVRHAAGARVTVRIQADADAVGIRIRNTAPESPGVGTGSGHGLRGMRERVELLGGTFDAAATEDGGWEVAASLPLAGPPSHSLGPQEAS